MLKQILLCQIALFPAIFASEAKKLLLSVEVCRHGERASNFIYDFTVDPYQNFQKPQELTKVGAQSHYRNGQGLRKFFDRYDGFLSMEYDPAEIYVQTTNLQRTADSAKA